MRFLGFGPNWPGFLLDRLGGALLLTGGYFVSRYGLYPAAVTSISTLNSGLAKPETIISVEAGAGSENNRSRTAI